MRQSNRQQPPIKRKPLKGQLNRQVKFSMKPPESTLPLPSLKSKLKQYESIQNVSLIEGSSFISNRQDGSMDSMDKMIIGVTGMGLGLGLGEKEFQGNQEGNQEENSEREDREDREEKSKGSGIDFDFNEIHKQYEKLIGRNQLLGEEEEEISDEIEESSRVLPDEDDWHLKQSLTLEKKLEKLSLSLSPKKKQSQTQIKNGLQKLQSKIDEIRSKKLQDNSNNSIKILVGNLGNLSQIHEQRQNNANNSVDTQHKRNHNNNEDDEQEFIDFVRQPDPHENTENQNIQKKHYFSDQNLGNQWEVSPMPIFEHLELELEKEKNQKKEKNGNYHQILEALNSKEEVEVEPEAQAQGEGEGEGEGEELEVSNQMMEFIAKREKWVKEHKKKSQSWKKKQLYILTRMRKIVKNPHYESQDSEQ